MIQSLVMWKKNKKALLDDLKGLDGIEEHRLDSSEEKVRKDDATVEMEKTILLMEVSWRQNSNRKCNSIENLVINGGISSNPAEIKEQSNFSLNYLSRTKYWRPNLDGLPFHSISEEEAIWME
jgi:hypothetical protein